MKLIIMHHYGDGYTYWGTDVIPIERESEEALIVELEEWACKNTHSIGWGDTGIHASAILGTDDTCSIEIMTLDSWWKANCVV